MGAGDTITGQVRYVREDQNGDRTVILGPLSQNEFDQSSLQDRIYANVDPQDLPAGAGNLKQAPNAKLGPGETLLIQHKSANLEEAIDYDADEFEIGLEEVDLNRGKRQPRTLTAADTDLSSNPTSSKTSWVTFFEDTAPDRTAWGVKGPQKAAAVEDA